MPFQAGFQSATSGRPRRSRSSHSGFSRASRARRDTMNGASQSPARKPSARISRATGASPSGKPADGVSQSPTMDWKPSSICTTSSGARSSRSARRLRRTSSAETLVPKRYHEHQPLGTRAGTGAAISRPARSAQSARPASSGAATPTKSRSLATVAPAASGPPSTAERAASRAIFSGAFASSSHENQRA